MQKNAVVGKNIGTNLETDNKNNEKYLMVFFFCLILIQPLGLATLIDNIGLLSDPTFHDTFIPPFGIFCVVFGIPFTVVCLTIGLVKIFFSNKIINYLFYVIFGVTIFLAVNFIFYTFTNLITLSFIVSLITLFLFFYKFLNRKQNG